MPPIDWWFMFAAVGMTSFVVGSLLPSYLMGGQPLVEALAQEKDGVHRTSSEACHGTDWSLSARETGASVAGAHAGIRAS